jgi:hypothetical protein
MFVAVVDEILCLWFPRRQLEANENDASYPSNKFKRLQPSCHKTIELDPRSAPCRERGPVFFNASRNTHPGMQ